MEKKQLPYDIRMYLCSDIATIADNLSGLDNDFTKSFHEMFNEYIPPVVKKNELDCFRFHIDEIKQYTRSIYDSGNRPSSFIALLDRAIDAYICEKLIIQLDIIAYNFLVNYVNSNNIKVDEKILDAISSNISENTTLQHLIDVLNSFLEVK